MHLTHAVWPPPQLFMAPNYHMTELQAAVGRAQLEKLPAMVAQRRASAQQLAELLEAAGAMEELGLQRVGDLPECEGSAFWYQLRRGMSPELTERLPRNSPL
jgi:perosamine synthetase